MAKHFKTPPGGAGRESTDHFERLPAQTTAPRRRSWDDDADVTASGSAAGGTISDVETSGSATFSTAPEEHSHNGLQVFYGVLELLPRTDATVTYTVTTSAEAGDQPLTVRTTPTCQAAR